MNAAVPLKVALLSPIWPPSQAELVSRHEVIVASSAEDRPAALAQADAAVVRSGVRVDGATLALAPRLRLIVRAGVGIDGIDLDAAREQGVQVITTPESAASVAEHAIALALALSHRLVPLHQALAAGRWEKGVGHGRDLLGRQLGVVGFGRIGQRTALVAHALGMSIVAADRTPDKPEKQAAAARVGARFVSLAELFATSDVVTMHTPLSEESRRMVGAPLLRSMKRDALLINVGRGGTIDEEALYAALRDGALAGAALDVFEQEPPGESPLFTLPNFLGTPHIAAQTVDAQQRIGQAVVAILDTLARGDDFTQHGQVVE